MIDQRTAYITQGKPPRKHLTQMDIAKWRKTKTFNKAFTCRAVFGLIVTVYDLVSLLSNVFMR